MNFTSCTSGLSAVSYYLFVYLGESLTSSSSSSSSSSRRHESWPEPAEFSLL